MKKFLTIINACVLTFAFSSVVWAQQKTAAQQAAPRKTETAHAAAQLKTATGRITAVDAKAKTLTVAEGTNSVTFLWNEKTKITEAGHAVKPSALVSGAQVTVHYQEKGGRNWASSIVITPVTAAAKKK